VEDIYALNIAAFLRRCEYKIETWNWSIIELLTTTGDVLALAARGGLTVDYSWTHLFEWGSRYKSTFLLIIHSDIININE
jgi:hypothetical protein